MRMQRGAHRSGLILFLSLAVALSAPWCTHGAEPSEIVGAAYRASSQGLKSGIGKGRYRRYQATPGGDWELRVDAEVSTYFDGNKYHIDLTFVRDSLRHNTAAHIVYDGRLVMMTWFSPNIRPVGAHTIVEVPNDYGDMLRRPDDGTFPWDVAQLSGHVWNGERLIGDVAAGKLMFTETPAGDLVGTNPIVINRSRTRIECPRRFAFNIAKAEFSVMGEDRPRTEYLLQWKQEPGGLWYVTVVQKTSEFRTPADKVFRLDRKVLMYSRFEPNAKVDQGLFTEESLQMPDGCRIMENRRGEATRVRIYRKPGVQ